MTENNKNYVCRACGEHCDTDELCQQNQITASLRGIHQVSIPESPTCSHTAIIEYWHESDDCELSDCAVDECYDCGSYATECGDEYLYEKESK